MSKKKVLVIDYQVSILHILRITLEEAGFEVITANGSNIGIPKAQSYKPDIIILNAHMPILDGIETCRRIKADSNIKDIPVILLMQKMQTEKENKEKTKEVGAIAYFVKPFSPNKIIEFINAFFWEASD